jgi:hypothetical protein
MRKDLNAIAVRIYNRVTKDPHPWRPTTAEISRAYKLTEKQTEEVKRKVKRIAAENGVIWGYDPDNNHFTTVPDVGGETVAKRVLGYALSHWQSAGNSVMFQFLGGYKQGYVTERLSRRVRDLESEFSGRVDSLNQELGVANV